MDPTKRLLEITARLKAISDAADTHPGDQKGLLTDAQLAEVTPLIKEARDLKAQIDGAAERNQISEQMKALLGDTGAITVNDTPDRRRKAGEFLTPQQLRGYEGFGDAFTQSPEWTDFLKSIAPSGSIPRDGSIKSPPVGFQGSLTSYGRTPQGAKTLVTGASDTSAGAFVTTDRTDIFETLGRRPLLVRDAFSKRTTISDTIEYVQQTSRVNAAAFTAEATAVSGSSGTKPEGGFAFQVQSTVVKTVAEWVPATRRALADSGQLRGIIDQELLADLKEEEEDQLMTGDGTGENLLGLLNVSGTQAQTYDTDVFTTTDKAKWKVQTVGRAFANAFMFNPSDWQGIELLQDNVGRFYGDGPFGVTTPRLWNLPVIVTEAVPAGTGLVGDFTKCVIWDRQQAQILVSDSHADFFVRNMIAILAEQREAFGVTRPSAIVVIDLTP